MGLLSTHSPLPSCRGRSSLRFFFRCIAPDHATHCPRQAGRMRKSFARGHDQFDDRILLTALTSCRHRLQDVAQERLGALVLGMLKHLIGRSLLHDFAIGHEDDAMRRRARSSSRPRSPRSLPLPARWPASWPCPGGSSENCVVPPGSPWYYAAPERR